MKLKALLLLAAGLGMLSVPSAGRAPESNEPTYLVSLTMRDGVRVVGSPALTVRANHAAEVDIGEEDGSRYRVRFTVEPRSDRTVAFRSSMDVTRASGARRTAEPVLIVEFRQEAAVAFGVESATEQPFRLELKVEPARTPTN